MKIVSGYLIFSAIIIVVLSITMVWQFNSFQQNLSHLSYSLPAPEQMPSLNVGAEIKKIADQAATQAYPATKEFNSPDKSLSFFYSPLWQETAVGPVAAGQGTTIFSASRINISQLSLAYLTVRELPLADKDDIINILKSEIGGQAKLTIDGNSQMNAKNGTIEIIDATYDLGTAYQNGASTLGAKIAIANSAAKSFIVSIYGSKNVWDSMKPEADALFSSIQINEPAAELKK